MNEVTIDDLNAENQTRLRSEVHIIAMRLRRHLMRVYKERWAESVLDGRPLRLRGDPDEIDRLAMQAAQSAFGGGRNLDAVR